MTRNVPGQTLRRLADRQREAGTFRVLRDVREQDGGTMGAGVFSTACISPVGYSPGLFSSSSDQELCRIRVWHNL